jgi:DNA-binding NarL/FixJ family response regulator
MAGSDRGGQGALDRFAHGADWFASGDACYQQAEAYRVLGESAAAEDAYQQASRWGREPQPGLALLRLAQGKTDAAAAAIGRAVTETTDPLRRVKLLPAQVEIMLAAGEVQAARDAAAELIQISGARTVFAQLGAAPELARVEALARSDAASNAHGLTERELQVLRLLATGTTNHAIANELVLSEKTVHRHVSNIFSKLGVSSRAAATAYAYQHRLL